MESAMYLGGFFIVWGMLYLVFAFIGRESELIGRFFKVPALLIFFVPDRLLLPIGRIMTGILFMAVGVFLIAQFANLTQIPF